MAEVRATLDALADEPRTLGVSLRALVEAVDLELEPVVAKLEKQVALKKPGRLVGSTTTAERRHDREPADASDAAALVHTLEAHRTCALAADLDDEAAERLGLRERALHLGRHLLAPAGAPAAEERLDVRVVDELDEELDIGGAGAAKRDVRVVRHPG